MQEIRISDATIKQVSDIQLSFREKLELSKLLDKLGVSAIELEPIRQIKADSLLVKSVASAVRDSIVAVPVELNNQSVEITWNALKGARRARLQIEAPVSSVQMEYIFHKKPEAMLEAIKNTVAACRAKTDDVEFIADDATRSDADFLYKAVSAAISAGAGTVTVCDTAGAMLADEFSEFIRELYENVPELYNVTMGVSCSDSLSMASACAIAAVRCGARELKATSYPANIASLQNVSGVLASKGEMYDVWCPVRMVEMKRIINQITWMCQTRRSKNSPFDTGVQETAEEVFLTAHDDKAAVITAVNRLGYDLSEEDELAVWEAFGQIAARKDRVGSRELDAIVASAAMQVPATYQIESYLINTGNITTAMAHIKLKKNERMLEGIALGDGPIDAAFLALEQIIGHHYELDDFQIQAVTEGHEAMGETVVRLLSGGRLYAGRGISTDIVGSSIQAYINALNKIVYEEAGE